MFFRCQNANCSEDRHGRLIFDFEANEPVCPKCGCDARDPRYADTVIQLEVIHFDPPDERLAGKGKNILACNPRRRVGATVRASGDPTVVNCPACKATDAYQKTVESGLDGRPAVERILALGGHLSGAKDQLPDDQIGPEAGCCS